MNTTGKPAIAVVEDNVDGLLAVASRRVIALAERAMADDRERFLSEGFNDVAKPNVDESLQLGAIECPLESS